MKARWQASRQFDPALPELRRRTAWLMRGLEPRARALVRLVPLLLTARFRRPLLDRDAPGLVLRPRRRRWGVLCAALELPPPTAFTSSRPLVEAALLAPLGDGRLELLLVPVEDVPPGELPRLVARVEVLTQLAARHAPALEVRLASRAELTDSLLPWAAVCAGALPTFAAAPLDRLEVVLRAPTPLARCLALLVDEDAAPPLEVLRADRGDTRPEAFAARWGQSPTARAAVAAERSTLEELEATAAALRRACAWALRRLPPGRRRPLRALVRSELFGAAIPAVFRPTLERLLRGRVASERVTPQGWELLVDETPVARATSLDQLRATAVSLTPTLARAEGPWGRVALLAAGGARAVALVEAPDQPHLALRAAGAGRLKARRVDAEGLLRFAMSVRARGATCEVVAGLESDQALVSRLGQVAALPLGQHQAVGVEVGRRLLLADGHRVRSVPLKLALSRPRGLTWLPADPELRRSLRRPSSVPLPTVAVTAWPLGEDRAAVYSLDAQGVVLREEVGLTALESHLVESRELLRAAPRPTLMSVVVHPRLSTLAGRRHDGAAPPLLLDLEHEWPFTVRVWLEGEAFCAPGDLGWSSLAEAILSHWAPGTWGRVGVRRLAFIDAPPALSPLHYLAVRSRVLRRLGVGLKRLSRALQAA